MDFSLKLGLTAKSEHIVQHKDTAKSLGSGRAQVLATPRMIALMENAAYTSVQPVLAQGQSTVGVSINAKHLAATPVGIKVWAKATLVDIDRKKLTFTIEAHDETELIGSAVHERFIIDEQKFADKANTKVK